MGREFDIVLMHIEQYLIGDNGGESGIRTHVLGKPNHLISSQRRYDHFGTSPNTTTGFGLP